jgi:hypothetical protein
LYGGLTTVPEQQLIADAILLTDALVALLEHNHNVRLVPFKRFAEGPRLLYEDLYFLFERYNVSYERLADAWNYVYRAPVPIPPLEAPPL